jgi:hypothetical protein
MLDSLDCIVLLHIFLFFASYHSFSRNIWGFATIEAMQKHPILASEQKKFFRIACFYFEAKGSVHPGVDEQVHLVLCKRITSSCFFVNKRINDNLPFVG